MQPLCAIDTLRWVLFVLAALVAGQAALGFSGLFGGNASAVLLALVVGSAALLAARAGLLSAGRPLFAGWQPLETGLLAAVVAALVTFVWIAAGRETFTYDSISFHLYFPASWMDTGRLEIVPMVFGDVAPAYNPSNVELLIHLLMAPLHSGYLSECVQAPFALVAVLAIHATARELGAARSPALAACLLFLLIPEVWVQSTLSMVDLAVGALFLATLPFLIRMWRSPTWLDFAALSVAWGLFIGTKFIALPYSAPLMLAAAVILWRHRAHLAGARVLLAGAAAAGALVFATGGFWYLRNVLATGNPIYPLHIELLGSWRLEGLYDASLMRQWDYHVPVGSLDALGERLLGAGIGFAASGLVALLVRWRGPELSLAMLQLATFWLWIPYQHARFLFGFFGVVAVAQAVATRDGRAAILCRLLLLGAIAGSLIQWPEAPKLAVVGVGLLGATLPRVERLFPLRLPVLGAALVLVIVIASGLPAYRERYPRYSYGEAFYRAWEWTYDNVSDATVAYAGSNLPFPLYGRNLSNRVTYANVALGPRARVHDFPSDAARVSAEPTHYRNGAAFETWMANLRALRCDFLFVSSMFPIVQRSVEHDPEGFPVERAWADAQSEAFRLRYATPGIRIYEIIGAGDPPIGL
jgi:hypothetical protein